MCDHLTVKRQGERLASGREQQGQLHPERLPGKRAGETSQCDMSPPEQVPSSWVGVRVFNKNSSCALAPQRFYENNIKLTVSLWHWTWLQGKRRECGSLVTPPSPMKAIPVNTSARDVSPVSYSSATQKYTATASVTMFDQPTPSSLSFPGGSDGKESACNTGDVGWIPGAGRSSGKGNGSPLQYSCLENSVDKRSLVGYSPWGRKESDTTEQLKDNLVVCSLLVDGLNDPNLFC